MDYLQSTSDHSMFQETAGRYAADRLQSSADQRKFMNEWQDFAKMGWLAITVPEDAGGMGGSLVDAAAVIRGVAPMLVREPLITSAILCTAIVGRIDDEAFKRTLLEDMASGTVVMALADSGLFDQSSPRPVSARRDGEGYRLDGVCLLSRHAPTASKLIVEARLPGQAGIGLFLLDPLLHGVRLDAYTFIDGTAAADVILDDVVVSPDALLLKGQKATEALEMAVDEAALALAAEATGIMRELLTLTADHLRTRVQFGKELRAFQALQHRVSEMFIAYQDTVSIVDYALKQVEAGTPSARAAVSCAKVVAAEAAMLVGKLAIQLHGAIGITEEGRVGRYYKRLLVFERLYGSPAFHLERYQKITATGASS